MSFSSFFSEYFIISIFQLYNTVVSTENFKIIALNEQHNLINITDEVVCSKSRNQTGLPSNI